MRKIYLSMSVILFTTIINAQPWLKNIPKVSIDYKESKSTNFHDIKKAFDDYWKNKKVFENETENAKEGGYQQFARWEYLMRYRTYPDGEFFDSDILYKELNREKAKQVNNITLSSANWSYIGQNVIPVNGGGTGRINVVRIHPTNPNILFVGAACGGVWKSTDGGSTWSTSTDLLPSVAVADIAINPVHPDTMYVATGDGYGYEVGSDFWGGIYTGGLFMSADGGNTWSPTPLSYIQLNKQILHRIIINPQNPNILFASSRNYLYKSVDAGQSWTRIFTGHFYDIEFHPTNPDIIYAAASTKVYKSSDGGVTFTPNVATLGSGRMSISVTPVNPDVLYALSENGNFWKSTDAGVTFVQKTSPDLTTTFYGYYDNVLSVSPVDENYVITGGVDLLQSFNGGQSWQLAANAGGNDYVHVDQKNLEFQAGSGSIMYAVNDGGIFKTVDGGNNWTDLGDNIYIKQYYRMSSGISNPNTYYAGAQDNGTDQFTGILWRRVYGGDGMDCSVNPSNSNTAYVSSQYGNFRRTFNGGTNFSNITPAGQSGDWITPIAIDPVNNSTIYIGYQDLYHSFDNGGTWNILHINLFPGDNITRIKIAPSDNNYIYAGTLNSMKRSFDGGSTFTSVNSGLPVALVALTDIAISSTDHDLIWATFSGYTFNQKVYTSVDGGLNWINVSGSLPNIPVNCIVYQPGSNDMVYVGTDLGVYYRDNSMADWLPYNNGLPNVMVSDLEIIPSINKLRAATYGRGIWQTDLAVSVINFVDAGIISFSPSLLIACDQNITPSILAKNYGSSVLTSFTINYSVDGGSVQSFTWTGNISSQGTTTFSLPVISIADGAHSLLVYLTDPNGITDPNNINDSITSMFTVASTVVTAPIIEDFEGTFPPIEFRIEDSAGLLSVTNAAGAFGTSASSLKADFFNTINGRSLMTSYPIDITGSATPELTFDVAYVRYHSAVRDSLIVEASTDCGLTWTTVYSKMGTALATQVGFFSQLFLPTPAQWRHEVVSLTPYASANNLLLRFIFSSGYGNNLYLDNINIDNTVGVQEISQHAFALYPNPASDFIYLQAGNFPSKILDVTLTDMAGRIIFVKQFNSVNALQLLTIPVTSFSTGYYTVTIKTETDSAIKYPVMILRE